MPIDTDARDGNLEIRNTMNWFTRMFIKKLVRGSRNIDRMRDEIDQVIGMIIGMPCVAHLQGSAETVHWVVRTKANRTEDYIWVLSSDSNGRLRATFHCGDQEFPMSYYSSEHGSKRMKLSHVKITHDYLGLFVKKMKKTYPDMPAECKPLLDAA